MIYIFIAFVLIIFCLTIKTEYNQPIWRELASEFPSYKHDFDGRQEFFESLPFWNGSGDKGWHNVMCITFEKEGILINPPFFKPYIKSVFLPWGAVELDRDIIWLFQRKTVIKVPKLDIYIALKRKHKDVVQNSINAG